MEHITSSSPLTFVLLRKQFQVSKQSIDKIISSHFNFLLFLFHIVQPVCLFCTNEKQPAAILQLQQCTTEKGVSQKRGSMKGGVRGMMMKAGGGGGGRSGKRMGVSFYVPYKPTHKRMFSSCKLFLN